MPSFPLLSHSIQPSKRCKILRDNHPSIPKSLNKTTNKSEQPLQQSDVDLSVQLPIVHLPETQNKLSSQIAYQIHSISAEHLAVKLNKQCTSVHRNLNRNVIILDCRSFISYNESHIKGAININCSDRFNRKRLQNSNTNIAELANTKDGKEILKKRNWNEVIVYDDSTDSLENSQPSQTIHLVVNSLLKDKRKPVLLIGGINNFQMKYSSLCENHLRVPTYKCDLTLPTLKLPTSSIETLPSAINDIENHPASQVTPYMYLGNMKDAGDIPLLERLGVTHVLNVTSVIPTYSKVKNIKYKQLQAADNNYQNLKQYFDQACEFIDKARENGGRVLVHCHAGVSRSPTLSLAYLIKHQAMALPEAYKLVKAQRNIISPNLNFMGQLLEFEKRTKAKMIKKCELNNNKQQTRDNIDMVSKW